MGAHVSGDGVARYGDLVTIDNKGHVEPYPILQRFNTLEGSRCKRLKNPEVAGRQRISEPSINRDACQYIINSRGEPLWRI
jgi:hypothetical protein